MPRDTNTAAAKPKRKRFRGGRRFEMFKQRMDKLYAAGQLIVDGEAVGALDAFERVAPSQVRTLYRELECWMHLADKPLDQIDAHQHGLAALARSKRDEQRGRGAS